MILPTLLHYANRASRDERFYAIKTKILQKYAQADGSDIQYIHGKSCYSCGGTGVYKRYDNYGQPDHDACWNCYNGWYKRPKWVVLRRYKFGKYIFHQPVSTHYSQESIPPEMKIAHGIIDGYVEHKYSKWSKTCRMILFWMYDFKYWWNEESGRNSYYHSWFHTPEQFIHNFVGLFRSPFIRSKTWEAIRKFFWIPELRRRQGTVQYLPCDDSDLPF